MTTISLKLPDHLLLRLETESRARLTALLNPNDEWHAWARESMRHLRAPLLTS